MRNALRELPPRKPTVGRIVHYFAPKSLEPFAAIVTKVWPEGAVSLMVFPPDSHAMVSLAHYRCDPGDGPYWDWPEGTK